MPDKLARQRNSFGAWSLPRVISRSFGPFRLPHLPPSHAASVLLRGLNREQRRAVSHGDGPALVIAGPGTGKTEVVTRRIAWLIATKRALPREILALTFTDNAAQEMQARVDLLVPYGQADTVIQTFHAFGDALLREHAFELGRGANLRLLSRAELIVFLRERVFQLGLERYLPLGDPTRFLGVLIDFFGRAKDENVTAATLSESADRLRDVDGAGVDRAALLDLADARAELATAFASYCEVMAANGLIDHSDQVALALELLRSRRGVAAQVARRFRYVLVDELQDTNRAQLELVLALAGTRSECHGRWRPGPGDLRLPWRAHGKRRRVSEIVSISRNDPPDSQLPLSCPDCRRVSAAALGFGLGPIRARRAVGA